MKSKVFLIVFCFISMFLTNYVIGQEAAPATAPSPPKFKIGGMMQVRYWNGFDSNINSSDGKYYTNSEEAVSNYLEMRRVRLNSTFNINERLEATILVNFADFKTLPTNKVLENAFVKYKFSKQLNIIAGQFRPAFGLENTASADVLRSIDYSNGYNDLGANGWQSFQTGVSVIGDLPLPIQANYAISYVNGNGKNQTSDNNDNKLISGRLQFTLSEPYNFKVGGSGGVGNEWEHQTYILSADLTADFNLGEKTVLQLQAEAKQGTNHAFFGKIFAATAADNKLDDYAMRGAYFLPNIRFLTPNKNLNSLNFSCRYEYWDSNFKTTNNNYKQTITPMIAAEFLKDDTAKLSFGVQIDKFKKSIDIDKTSMHDNNMFFMQFQVRY